MRLRGRSENYRPHLFVPELWNKRHAAIEGIARTTNACKGWYRYHSLPSIFLCDHPSMWFFLEGIKKDKALQTDSFLQRMTGSQRPQKKAYRNLYLFI